MAIEVYVRSIKIDSTHEALEDIGAAARAMHIAMKRVLPHNPDGGTTASVIEDVMIRLRQIRELAEHESKVLKGVLTLVLFLFAAGATAGPVLQKPGTLCEKGLKYDVVKVEGKWKALCYEGDVEEARASVGADLAFPSSEHREGPCMTCSLEEEAYIYYRTRNKERLWK